MVLPETIAPPGPENNVTTWVSCPSCNVIQTVFVDLSKAKHIKGSIFLTMDNCGACGGQMNVFVNKDTQEGVAYPVSTLSLNPRG